MSTYSTSVPENKKDTAELKNPFNGETYYRGKLQVKVDSNELLGSEAQAVFKRQMQFIPATTHPDFPAIIDPTHIALGPFLSGINDNLFFDACLNVGTNAVFGYNHPNIFPKLQNLGRMLAGYMGAGTDFFFACRNGAPAPQDLAELMTGLAKDAYGEEYMMNFANAGTEANENAFKFAMFNKFKSLKSSLGEDLYRSMCEQLGYKTLHLQNGDLWSNYPLFLMSFQGAFHGRTATSNSLSMSKTKQKEGYQAVPYVVHVPFTKDIDFNSCIDETPIEDLIKNKTLADVIKSGKAPADLLAAIIMEPIQGEGGYVIPDHELLKKVSDFVGKYRPRGLSLISDEVQTGLYRTGTFTGMQNWYAKHPNLRPDIMSFAKPLHVGGVLVQKRIAKDWPGGKVSGTWAEGNLLGIAMAVYTLEEMKRVDPALGKPYPEHCIEAGKYLRDSIAAMAGRLEKKFPGASVISNIRGVGQMNAFDVPGADFQNDIVYKSFLHGLHILGTGKRSIRIFGTVDQRQREADMLIGILEDVITEVAESSSSLKKSEASSHAR